MVVGVPVGVLDKQRPGLSQVVRGLDRQQLQARQAAAGQPGQRAGRRQLDERGRAEAAHRDHALVPPDRSADLCADPLQPGRAGPHHRAVPVGQHSQRRVAHHDRGRRAAHRIDRGLHVPGVERARHLELDQLGSRRRVGGQRAEPVGRARGDDLAGPVHVRRGEVVRLDPSEHVGLDAPEHGGHRGRLGSRRVRHRPAPDADQPYGVLRAQHPGDRPSGQLAHAVPGRDHAVVGVGDAQRRGGDERGRHEQRLSYRGVPDFVGVGGCPVPDQVASGQIGPGPDLIGYAGQLEPGREEPRSLSALPGRGDDEHLLTLHCRSPPYP